VCSYPITPPNIWNLTKARLSEIAYEELQSRVFVGVLKKRQQISFLFAVRAKFLPTRAIRFCSSQVKACGLPF